LENIPRIAKLPGAETATFPITHNFNIRKPEDLPEDEVLVVGAGPSSMDIAQLAACSRMAKKTVLLHRKQHLGMPDFWLPEMNILYHSFRTLRLPKFVIDTFFTYYSWLWGTWNGVEAWKPAKDTPMTNSIAYALRSEMLPAVKDGRLFPMVGEVKQIRGSEVELSVSRGYFARCRNRKLMMLSSFY
jgi:hypothetical protein